MRRPISQPPDDELMAALLLFGFVVPLGLLVVGYGMDKLAALAHRLRP